MEAIQSVAVDRSSDRPTVQNDGPSANANADASPLSRTDGVHLSADAEEETGLNADFIGALVGNVVDPAHANGDPDKIYPQTPIPPGGLPLNQPGTHYVSQEEFMHRVNAMATDLGSSLFHNGEMDNTPENMHEMMRRIANLRLSFGDIAPDELTKPFAEVAADRASGRRPPPRAIEYL